MVTKSRLRGKMVSRTGVDRPSRRPRSRNGHNPGRPFFHHAAKGVEAPMETIGPDTAEQATRHQGVFREVGPCVHRDADQIEGLVVAPPLQHLRHEPLDPAATAGLR